METTITTKEEEFLIRAIKFCTAIDNYASALDLDTVKLQAFKSDKMLLDFALKNREHFQEFTENSLQYNMSNLQASFSDLAGLCKNSSNYTSAIGEELGIEGEY